MSGLEALERLRQKLAALADVPPRVAVAVAPRIEMQARQDMTTSRGYVPPVEVTAEGSTITVSVPERFFGKIDPEAYGALVADEARKAFEEALR